LKGATTNQIRRYGFSILKLENNLKSTIDYVTALLLCSGRGGQIWQAYSSFKQQTTLVWQMLRKARAVLRTPESTNDFPHRRRGPIQIPLTTGAEILDKLINARPHDPNHTPSKNTSSHVSPFIPHPLNPIAPSIATTSPPMIENATIFNMIDLLEAARPPSLPEKRSPILVGLGLGFFGNYLLSQYFGSNNDADIASLNENLRKVNSKLLVTNRRIDFLAKNISNSVNVIKSVLDKLVEAQQTSDIHYAVQWTLDQLVSSIQNVKDSFKFSELTITLLQKGILNAELLDLKSLKRTIEEGLQSFPKMSFPLEITRYQLKNIVKIVRIEFIGHLKYILTLPLTRKQEYEVYTLIPHPVKVGSSDLVLPEIRNTILKNEVSYIVTKKSNVYSISNTQHIMIELEPMYNIDKGTCEWEGYLGNASAMLQLCNYKKVGQISDIFVTETENYRLVHFSKRTKVTLDCPEKQVRDSLEGLHRLPLACDIQTDTVFWPAKQTVTVNLDVNQSLFLDSSNLPLISVNASDKVHSSLRDLISKLPKKGEPFTIDFHDIPLEDIQSISVYTHLFTIIIVVINSILIGVLIKRARNNTLNRTSSFHSSGSYVRDKFRDIRDSIRNRKRKLHGRDTLRRVRDSLRSRGSTLRDSIRSGGSTIKSRVKRNTPASPKVIKTRKRRNPSSDSRPPPQVTAETNTDWQLPPYAPPPKTYPILPRYS